MEAIVVNGREYPLWGQFINGKHKWIGGLLRDYDFGTMLETSITDIRLDPNGNDSAFFRICGKDFDCGFDVQYGGISCEKPTEGFLRFSGYGGHTFEIREKITH